MGEVAQEPVNGSRISRLQSPTRFVRLGSNDDELERAQSRAAARRRRSFAAAVAQASQSTAGENPSESKHSDLMDKEQIMELFHNCIKLASENKINQKNTWELGLIDHLSEIIKVETEEDDETNFQKASCTLEAGVKIYSLRVDSVHSEAYKVLGGINRAGREEAKGNLEEGVDNAGSEDGPSKKEQERKVLPTSTLESSFEALNVKKFDVAFTVDPLYHQTSAQFDEGGAKGLLLYNLGIYGQCRVLFDSFEIPEKFALNESQQSNSDETIDLSFAYESIEKMVSGMPNATDISPTLREIIDQFDQDNQRPSDSIPSVDHQTLLTEENISCNINDDTSNNEFVGPDPGNYENYGENFCYDDDQESAADDGFTAADVSPTIHPEANGGYMSKDPAGGENIDKIADFLSLGLGFSSKTNAWAGPDHWKFRKIKGSELVEDSSGEKTVTAAKKKPKSKKGLPDLDFTKPFTREQMEITFLPPKNPKSLLLPANRDPCNTKLPEDCHYRPDRLVKLFLRPDVLCLGRKARKSSNEEMEENGEFFQPESWDNNDNDDFSDNGIEFGFGNNVSTDEPGSLLRKPRQVNKIEIEYDKVSKQVDVHALKDLLWNNIQDSFDTPYSEEKEARRVPLSEVLHRFPCESPRDISPHLFFICLLHLANEHSLVLCDRPTLDEIDIEIPSSSISK